MRSNDRDDPNDLPGLDQEQVFRDFIQDDLSDEEIEAVHQWQRMAQQWDDEVVPQWRLPRIARQRAWLGFNWDLQSWFPTLASATALTLVLVMFFGPPPNNDQFMQTSDPAYASLPVLPIPEATQTAMMASVLESSRDERQIELQSLARILKAYMDRRSLETEESLRYVISHQLQGQQELEDLYQQVEALMVDDSSRSSQANTLDRDNTARRLTQ